MPDKIEQLISENAEELSSLIRSGHGEFIMSLITKIATLEKEISILEQRLDGDPEITFVAEDHGFMEEYQHHSKELKAEYIKIAIGIGVMLTAFLILAVYL